MISYALNFEDVMLMRALKSVEAGFYIDVGANHPETYSVTKAFYDLGWRGVNIEPMPGPYALLAAQRPRDINLACAIGAQNGVIDIWEPDVEGWATGRPDIAAQLIAEGHVGVYHATPLRTLADVCGQWAPRDIHFLKIDVEGLEKDVLLGADFTRYRPWVAVVEATRPNSAEETHDEWEPLLLEADYRFVYADGLNRFYVAAERQELAGAFRYPPNVFDGFKLNTQLQAEIAAAENRAAAHDAAAIAENAQESMRQAHETAQAAHVRAQQALEDAWRAENRAQQAEQEKLHAVELAKWAEKNAKEALSRAGQAVADRHAADEDRRAADADRRQTAAALEQAVAREQQTQSALQQAEHALQQTQAALQQAEQARRDVEAWAHWAEERARRAEADAAAAQGQIAVLHASTSWRVTGPLRAAGAVRRGGAAKFKSALLRRVVGFLQRPAVKTAAVGLARRFGVFSPLRAVYLAWRAQAAAVTSQDENAPSPNSVAGDGGAGRSAAQPARVQAIHARLQAALEAVRPHESPAPHPASDPGDPQWRKAAAELLRSGAVGLGSMGLGSTGLGGAPSPASAAHAAEPGREPGRRRLAYVSPLPPERSGVADYSADLLPELARWYDIDVVVDQPAVAAPWVAQHCGVLDIDAFFAARHSYDRILYHFGNSPFHRRMFDLLKDAPGVVVLHDYHLGDIMRYREVYGLEPHAWTRELYRSAGYAAVAKRYSSGDPAEIVAEYPVNFSVLRDAVGVISHNDYSRRLAAQAYGEEILTDWRRIPLLRVIGEDPPDRAAARRELGLPDDAFVVCAFGMLGPTKLNLELLQAWRASALADEPGGRLIFVGENHPGDYGAAMDAAIKKTGGRVSIAGWTAPADYRRYLAAADMAVQLRGASRGETSAAVMDCLGYGVPTIVNANGSAAELPKDAAAALPDVFSIAELTCALEDLRRDPDRRARLAQRGRTLTATLHAPAACARLYGEAIEQFYADGRGAPLREQRLIAGLAALPGRPPRGAALAELAAAVAKAAPRRKAGRQVLLDVSAISRGDLQTGIQRVVRALTLALLNQPPPGWRIEPVCLSDQGGVWGYRYLRGWTSRLLGAPDDWLGDEAVELHSGDVFLGADFIGEMAVEADRAGVYAAMRAAGAEVHFIVYDLLPILLPQAFPPGRFGFNEWLRVVGRQADGVMCISRAVAADFEHWATEHAAEHEADHGAGRARPLRVGWFHLGDDLENSDPSRGRPPDADALLAAFSARPSFLMVGTVEPRKGYLQTLAAFDLLWQAGLEVNLVVAGREGWRGLPDGMRRTIPEIIARLRGHPERGRRLFWLDDASDEFLEEVYAASSCLLAASEGEGFGLPLIEAARRGLPILARDLPVFQEVAGPHAAYFSAAAPEELAAAAREWLSQWRAGQAPASDGMPRRSWSQSARQLLQGMLSSGVIES